MKYLTGILFLFLLFSGCLVIENPHSALAPGQWRGVLYLDPENRVLQDIGENEEVSTLSFNEVTQDELPFNFEVVYTHEDTFHIELFNGEERILLDDIYYGLDRSTAKDTLVVHFPVYDSYLKAIFEERVLNGEWVVTNRGEKYSIPFKAIQGQAHRFTTLKKEPVIDVSGKWEVTFEVGTEDEYKAIGEFKQSGNELSGTFVTETGDYRFLEGTVQRNKLYLSCFDGSHAFLFEAKIMQDESMIGSFRSGKHYKSTWEAVKNEEFTLRDPHELTYLKEGYEEVSFSFPNTQGKMISFPSPEYEQKVVILQILGTWCPNCRDETNFLVDYLANNQGQFEVIALSFEKHKDKQKALNAISTYKKKLGIEYELLHAGQSNKKAAASALPMLNAIISYPTMIFIDKKGMVRKIHTGFYGPATSEYESFIRDFTETIEELSKEGV